MKRYSLLAFLFVTLLSVSAQTLEKTPSGIRLKLAPMDIEFRFYGPDIVRVLKTPPNKISKRVSAVIVKEIQVPKMDTIKTAGYYSIKTANMRIDVTINTGCVRFCDANGKQLLTEMDETTLFNTNNYYQGDTSSLVQQSFKLNDKEVIVGLGLLQNGRLNQRNTTVILRQSNTQISIPYFQSSKGYAVYWDNYSSTLFGDNSFDTHFNSEMGDCVDYCFIVGKTGDEQIAKMRALTGQSPMLPLWAFGFFQSKDRYKSQQELVDVVKQYRELSIPLDGIVLDKSYWGDDNTKWNNMRFDTSAFRNPKEMVNQVHAMNARMMISIWPSFGNKTPQFDEFSGHRSLLYFETFPRKSEVKVIDAYNPLAQKSYWKYVKNDLFNLGIDAWWTAGTEPKSYNLYNEQLLQPTYLGNLQMVCNLYPLMISKGVYENQRVTTNDKRVVILAQSAFAGQQRYGTICSSGEITSNWETLANQIPAALNLTASGIPYWSSDIGGFTSAKTYPNGVKDKAFHELYIRWMQFSVFTPMMRSHGADTPREIFQFGKPGDWSFDAQAKSIRLRYRLLPYIYSTAWQVTHQGKSFMRPLFFDFPEDPKLSNLRDEYLFGSSFLVAPVIKSQYVTKVGGNTVEQFEQTKSRSVYLPAGNWIDFWTGETIKGEQTIEKSTPIDIIPLYVPSGSIIPWGPDVTYASEKNWQELEIRVYPGANGSFTLFEDEGDTYNYEKGAYSTLPFTWNESTKTLTIGVREGTFKGMLKTRSFNVVLIKPGTNPADKSAVTISRKVTYKGKSIKVKL